MNMKSSDGLQDEALLEFYGQGWNRYTTSAKYLDKLFMHLNRGWIKRTRDEGRKDVYPIYTVYL